MQVQLKEHPTRHNMFGLAHTHLRFELGPNKFAATLFGNKGGYNWSVGGLTRGDPEYHERLGRVGCDLQLSNIFVTNATEFNTLILHPRDFTVQHPLGGDRCCRRPSGKPAEGMSLGVGDAGLQSPAGCLTIVMGRHNSFDSRVIEPVKTHAGRWSLIRPRGSHRKHESVCYAALETLDALRDRREAKDVRVKILWGLPGDKFPHPLKDSPHADTNRWLAYYVDKNGWAAGMSIQKDNLFLDLAHIAKSQLMQRGVPAHQIDLTHAYLPREGAYLDGREGQPRNLVVVKRLS